MPQYVAVIHPVHLFTFILRRKQRTHCDILAASLKDTCPNSLFSQRFWPNSASAAFGTDAIKSHPSSPLWDVSGKYFCNSSGKDALSNGRSPSSNAGPQLLWRTLFTTTQGVFPGLRRPTFIPPFLLLQISLSL